ncbi:hypothetical protein AX16_008073 [Volvariella volvacea WC 439]|nr:hypothetical protein AX16_008073 [Volvariella volvacea WC 439]
MFLCRRLLPQVQIARYNLHSEFSRRTLSSIRYRQPVIYSVRFNNDEASNRSSIPFPTPTHTLTQTDSAGLFSSLSPLNGTDASENIRELDKYVELRRQDCKLVATIPSSEYRRVLRQAQRASDFQVLQQALQDIVVLFPDDRAAELLPFALATCDLSKLPLHLVHLIVKYLQDIPDSPELFSTRIVDKLMQLAINPPCPNDTSLLLPLCPIIQDCLSGHPVPPGASAITYNPPSLIHTTFSFIHKLLTHSHAQQALDIFQSLITLGQIPPEAMQEGDSTSQNFTTIIYSALVRASMHWNWRPLAANLLQQLVSSPQGRDISVANVVVDTVYALLDTPNWKDIGVSGKLLRDVHPIMPAPDGLIRHFYTSAAECLQPAEAEKLYAFTRTPSIRDEHQYPPPQGAALPWLMHHLATRSKYTFLSRALATEVVEQCLPIPLQFRARFISDTARNGYGRLARALWERYAAGKDRELIVGNAALMVRMVSLFSHLSERTDDSLDARKSESEDDNPSLSHTELEERSADLDKFLERVITEYRQHHEPLKTATHQNLTSFARACFILGKFADGFEAFKILLSRREVPDLYDINVALTAMAEQRPRAAAGMIDRMIEKGLEPDAVTFGTVMHYAVSHKDAELVDEMVRRARELKGGRLSLKSVASIVRANVAVHDNASKAGLRARLQDALEIVQTLAKFKFASSPQTGKYLVSASLRAGDPELAFKFWRLLARHSAEWEDEEQVRQRRLISNMIWRRKRRGQLRAERAREMLWQLRHRDKIE